jgi:hypothetical protein
MGEESWHAARLIPTSGINGAEEQERRATSALLSVMTAVREFGRSFTSRFGAPAGPVEAFIEVPFDAGEATLYPDGLLRVTRGKKTWTALVEVKTGKNCLAAPQLEAYLDIAREQGFDAVITVSNEIPAIPGTHPTAIDKKKLRKVALHHVPWTEVLTEAIVQKVHRGVADPDQAWILGELIRYLEHPGSGALEFDDMSASWVTVRDAVTRGTLRASDKGAAEVAGRWDSLVGYTALLLGRKLGTEVQPAFTKRDFADPASHSQTLIATFCRDGQLDGGIRIPSTVGTLNVNADLRASQVSASVDVDAPREGRAATRVNWLTRQLKDAPETLRVDAFTMHSRGGSTSALLKDVRTNPGVLVEDPKREIRAFKLTVTAQMGTKRGRGRGSFVESVVDLVDGFYVNVMQNVNAWSARPPQLRHPEPAEVTEVGVSTALVSTALSSQDGAEHADPTTAGSVRPESTVAVVDDVVADSAEPLVSSTGV